MTLSYPQFDDDGDGGSRLTTVELAQHPTDLGPGLPPMLSTIPVEAVSLQFVDLFAGMTIPSHPAPARQFVVVLRGVIEAETTSGETLRLRAGDVGLAADIRGGHITRVIEPPVRLLFAVLPGSGPHPA
ncbi:hypothetical protein E1292_30060 [Nonomuraea deserti]|uniref:Cupin domain-containing protein n=1 Tax=Nonomuraea deserti TaxID=1848322 RepID=A0A4R4VJI9_9ACTN|nr:hypothetical protein [Nonomuraea deserti]TDD00030.1 hypothetical protein E1292_30060 [Nonomuraea deserti]